MTWTNKYALAFWRTVCLPLWVWGWRLWNRLRHRKPWTDPSTDPIKHVFVLMLENRSFDQVLGCFKDRGTYSQLEGIDPDALHVNSDRDGHPYHQAAADPDKVPFDPNHEYEGILEQLANNHGGFVRNYQRSHPNAVPDDFQSVTRTISNASRSTSGRFSIAAMVLQAAGYLMRNGPATPQERWEESSGYSPSTLASNIAALTCAASFARDRNDLQTAQFIQEYADFLECHIEPWTVTTEGVLMRDIRRHVIRIHPIAMDDADPDENPNNGRLLIRNRAPDETAEFAAKDIVDAGFLELVRYGIRKAGDPLIEDSLQVVDSVLKVETPYGPCWRRYNHDGYGQRADGGPHKGSGKGRAWPLLTGERGHYELAAGRDATPYLRALERFASCSGLLPEQIWDEPDRPDQHLYFGKPTGSATPLLWAHAEYIKLLRSATDGNVFDLISVVADRYRNPRNHPSVEVWKPNRRVRTAQAGTTLRIQVALPFLLHWTADEWETVNDTRSTAMVFGIHFVDIPIAPSQRVPIRFTFFWSHEERWEGMDYAVEVQHKSTDFATILASSSDGHDGLSPVATNAERSLSQSKAPS